MDLLPPGLERLPDTANGLNAGGPLRPPLFQELFDATPMEVFEAFVAIDPTLMPPRVGLRTALMHVHAEAGRVLPAGDLFKKAETVALLLKTVVSRFRELATCPDRRAAMYRSASLAQRESMHKIVGRVASPGWNDWRLISSRTPISRSLSPSTSGSRSHCSGVEARRFDDDASLEAELESLEEGEAWTSTQNAFDEDELEAELLALEDEAGVHPSPRSSSSLDNVLTIWWGGDAGESARQCGDALPSVRSAPGHLPVDSNGHGPLPAPRIRRFYGASVSQNFGTRNSDPL